MAAVTAVLVHIWIPLASGRAEHTGPIKASFHCTGLSTGPPPLSARRRGGRRGRLRKKTVRGVGEDRLKEKWREAGAVGEVE